MADGGDTGELLPIFEKFHNDLTNSEELSATIRDASNKFGEEFAALEDATDEISCSRRKTLTRDYANFLHELGDLLEQQGKEAKANQIRQIANELEDLLD